ncbi:alpha/beta hydrolase [Candidatus Saccharibacteria bacterium]|nr:alpha/beta hydrolase [Candidatus Saccharibacteria bacterium]
MKDLYIIHGWTYNVKPWESVIVDLGALGVNAELLKVPGLGEPSDKVWTIEDYVAWADAKIPHGAVALGHSNGGRILLNLLAQHGSDRLGGLILLDSAGIYEESNKRNIAKKLSKTFAPLKKNPLIRKAVHKVLGASDYDKAPENMKQTLDNMINSDKELDCSKITTKTQIIWGSDDTITPLRQGKKLHEQLANSELCVKEGWRHSHYLTSTKELAAEIAKQLEKLRSQTT